MATTTEKRVIIIDVKGSTKAIKDINALQKHAARADKNIARMGKTLGNLGFTIKAFIAYRLTAYIAGIGPAFLDTADSMSLMESRLKLVNGEMNNTNLVMDELFEIAERSRGSIDSISTLYTRLSVSAKELGASQREVLNFTELVSDTFLLSGASAGEAASGVTQISQAMSKGKLDGDEYKSVMENNTYFAQLLAKSLGVTRGELNAMAKAGQITSAELLKMGESVDGVRAQVDDMPVTFDQMQTAWGNAVAKMISDADSLTSYLSGRFKALTILANRLSDYFDDGATAQLREYESDLNDLIGKRIELEQQKARTGGFLDDLLNVPEKLTNQIDVLNQRINDTANNIFLLKKSLEDTATTPISTEGTKPAGESFATDDKKSKIKTLTEILKSYNQEQQLANQYLAQSSDLFQAGKISLGEYNHIYQQYAETAGLVEAGTNGFTEAQQRLNEIIEAGRTPREVLNDQIQEINDSVAEFSGLAPQATEAIAVLNAEFEKSNLKDNKEEWIDWEQTAETAVKGVTGAFIDMAISGKNSFADFAESFLINIAKMIAQAAILKAISSPTGGLFGLFPSANGNVFSGGSIVPFASGGVVTSPTFFPMANGIGLMGEAGPEAVMPLKRGADGKLGVEASGGGATVVNINNYSSGTATTTESTDSQGNTTIDVLIEEKVNAAIKQGGLDRQMQSTYGMSRRGY